MEGVFPFANVTTHRSAHRQDRQPLRRVHRPRDTCPFGMEIYSANEYWVKAASLLHTDPTGTKDLPDSPFTRNYFMSSHAARRRQRDDQGQLPAVRRTRSTRRPCSARCSSRWTSGRPRAPRRRRAWCRSCPTARWCRRCRNPAIGLPEHPGRHVQRAEDDALPVQLRARTSTRRGIPTDQPAGGQARRTRTIRRTGRSIRASCPKTDSDGNDIAGVRLPDVTVPLATYTGWALRAGAASGDGCEGAGQIHPVREDQGRPHGLGRSAAVDRGALRKHLAVLLRLAGAINDLWLTAGCCCRKMRRAR